MNKEVGNGFNNQSSREAIINKFGFIGPDGSRYSPVLAEQRVLVSKLVSHSKEEAREHVRKVPLAVKVIEAQMAAHDMVRGTQEYWQNIRKKEYRAENGHSQKMHGMVFAGGFYSVAEVVYSPLKPYFANQSYKTQIYNYDRKKYTQRKKVPGLLPRGTNVEPLEWQLDDFIPKVIDYSEQLGEQVVVGGHSKGGLLIQLALVVDSDFRKHVKFAFAIGSPIPDPRRINSTVTDQYLRWLDYFGADDFKFTDLINEKSVKMLDEFGFVSVVNRHDPIIGDGVALGKVYETNFSHCGMPFNREVLDVVSSHFTQREFHNN